MKGNEGKRTSERFHSSKFTTTPLYATASKRPAAAAADDDNDDDDDDDSASPHCSPRLLKTRTLLHFMLICIVHAGSKHLML